MKVQDRIRFGWIIAMLIGTSFIVLCSTETHSKIDQLKTNTVNNNLSFYLISPENNTTYVEDINCSYFLSEPSATLTFYLNGSTIPIPLNNSVLPLSLRGEYNLTGVAYFNNTEILDTVIFSYYPVVNADISYDAIFLNDWFIIAGATNHPTPCYKHNEPVLLNVQINEVNDTFSLKASYIAVYRTQVLGESNITWIDTNTLSILIEPISENTTMHWVKLDINSILPNGKKTINFFFFRAVKPPEVWPDTYANFVGGTHSGQVQGNFEVWRMISNLTGIFVYLDGDEILSYNENNISDFTGLLVISIDTTKYANGVHELQIIVTDFFNLTSLNIYSLTFNNEIIPTNGTPTNTSFPVNYLVSLIILSVVITSLKRKRKRDKRIIDL